MAVGPKENMNCILGVEMETDESDVSIPLDTNKPKYERP